MENTVIPAAAELLPPTVLKAIGALVLVSLAGTAVVRLTGVNIREPDAPTVASRMLRFADGADGSVLIYDASSGEQAARITGEQGFLRGAMRAMARERRAVGAGAQPAFELISRADGRLTLVDPVTHQRIDLESFGPTNAATFARLLPAGSTAKP
jgi:putative photosynthetic complex assembly protein